jgi:hypothetical protein
MLGSGLTLKPNSIFGKPETENRFRACVYLSTVTRIQRKRSRARGFQSKAVYATLIPANSIPSGHFLVRRQTANERLTSVQRALYVNLKL